MNDEKMIERAMKIAKHAHEGQFRKWGDKAPYFVHPERVATKVAILDGVERDDVCAALLHDVIEDVAIPNRTNGREEDVAFYEEWITRDCSELTLQLVWELTNPTEGPEWEGKPRVEKRKADWEHISKISNRAKRIKLVDRWDNLRNPEVMPPKLLKKYIPESETLLELCKEADPTMAKELQKRIDHCKELVNRR